MYKHLFFDLDHTIWDFETNSRRALSALYYELDLRQYGVQSPAHFIEIYLPINYQMWTLYREEKIDAPTVKIKRFQDTFKQFGVVDQSVVQQAKTFYLSELPLGGQLMPNARQTLARLKEDYHLHIVTNGFKAITKKKLEHAGIRDLFESVLSAEEAGALKPNIQVFSTALEMNNASANESLFIGDNLIADVQGAKQAGIDQVFFNPEKNAHDASPTYEIADFQDLFEILY